MPRSVTAFLCNGFLNYLLRIRGNTTLTHCSSLFIAASVVNSVGVLDAAANGKLLSVDGDEAVPRRLQLYQIAEPGIVPSILLQPQPQSRVTTCFDVSGSLTLSSRAGVRGCPPGCSPPGCPLRRRQSPSAASMARLKS